MRLHSLLILPILVLLSQAISPDHKRFPDPFRHPDKHDLPNEGEYFLALNKKVLKNAVLVHEFGELLTEEYPITIVRCYVGLAAFHIQTDIDEKTIKEIEAKREVRYLEEDKIVYGHATDTACPSSSPNPRTWGLDRIDQRPALNDPSTDPEHSTYEYEPTVAGQDTIVYVLDTGVEVSHPEFENRAAWRFTAEALSEGDFDGSGHGTHVAGTVASTCFGVAKKAKIIAMKVLDSNNRGTWSTVAAGLDILLSEIKAMVSSRSYEHWPHVVAIMAFGGPPSKFIDELVTEVMDMGIIVVASTGNNGQDPCQSSPSRVPDVIRVAASQSDDQAASFSRCGSCVDVFAPGVDIVSTYLDEDTASMSGSSMAAAHVAGAVARYITTFSCAPPSQKYVKKWLLRKATKDALSFGAEQEDCKNLLLFLDCERPNLACSRHQ